MLTEPPFSKIDKCEIHSSVKIVGWVNLYGSKIGARCKIGPFVEIGGSIIGNGTIISSHSYICPGVSIGDECFIAHGVMFGNDRFTDVPEYQSTEKLSMQFKFEKTKVGNRVRIGSASFIMPGIILGDGCIVGSGSVVTKDIHPGEVWYGNPARMGRRGA